VVSNPNYVISESVMLPFEFQQEMEQRAESLPAPKTVIGPLQTGSWGIVAALPGVGKSMWIKLLLGATSSKNWGAAGDWRAPERRPALLIDAEMSIIELAGRYADQQFDEWLGICSLDLLDRHQQRSFSLGAGLDHAALFIAAEPFDIIVIDNIEYTLEPAKGHNIWAPETWAQVEPITRWAKANNKLLILVDHLNKEGSVQGSMSKQRGASFVIRLDPEYLQSADLSFKSTFSKLRYQVDKKLRRDRIWSLMNDHWNCEICPNKPELVIELANAGKSVKEIAPLVELKKSQVYNIINKNKHLIHNA